MQLRDLLNALSKCDPAGAVIAVSPDRSERETGDIRLEHAIEGVHEIKDDRGKNVIRIDLGQGVKVSLLSEAEHPEEGGAAICEKCNAVFGSVDSCSSESVKAMGIVFNRIPYGQEQSDDAPKEDRCPCCLVVVGGYHHVNCDVDECPFCGEPVKLCNCPEGKGAVLV